MRTTTERKLSELRVQASEFIHKRLGKAPFLAVKYSRTGALAVCVWQDGVREYLWVDYTASCRKDSTDGRWNTYKEWLKTVENRPETVAHPRHLRNACRNTGDALAFPRHRFPDNRHTARRADLLVSVRLVRADHPGRDGMQGFGQAG